MLPIGVLRFSGNLQLAVQLYHSFGPPVLLIENTSGCKYSGNVEKPKLFVGIHERESGGVIMVASPEAKRISETLDYFVSNTTVTPLSPVP